jgi:hypothetical protein
MVLRYDRPVPRKAARGMEATMYHRRMSVAMTPPCRLQCMAAAAANVGPEMRAALTSQGWDVVDLSDGDG